MLPTGNVSIDQLTVVLSILPIDLTFVDSEDSVAFFTEGPNRVFARSRAIILGVKFLRTVTRPGAWTQLERILADFREGRENVAEFWIEFQGKFIHIRYFAVRDAAEKYLGTIEVTQDVTGIRIQGQRRLLQYAQEPAKVAN